MSQSRDAGGLEARHSGVVQQASESLPWHGVRREGAKTRLYRYVRSAPEGTPLSKIVSDVFGSDAGAGDADYQLARRFFERYSEFFKTDSRGGLTWVEPRIGLFSGLNLRQQYAKRKTSVGDGDAEKVVRDDDLGPAYAKDRAKAYLEKYLQIGADSVRESLFRAFIRDKAGTEDKWNVLQRSIPPRDYLCVPYATRHNDGGRASKVRDGFEHSLQAATERYHQAHVLTLTPDPEQHSGLSEALQSLSDNKKRLLSRLDSEYQLGYRPKNVSVLEFTESGIPHYHLVLFGVPGQITQNELQEMWRGYDGAGYAYPQEAWTINDGDTWYLHDDEQGRVSLSWYLGKAMRELVDIAESPAAELRDRLEDGDVSGWKQALYWATERQYYTCSPSLRRDTDSDGDDGLPHVSEWEFVGSAEYGDLPAYIRQEAAFVGGVPPPGG